MTLTTGWRECLMGSLDEAYSRLVAGDVCLAMAELAPALEHVRRLLDRPMWKGVIQRVIRTHPLQTLLREHPLIRRGERTAMPPSVDALALDLLLGSEQPVRPSPLGAALLSDTRGRATAVSLAARHVHLSHEISRLATKSDVALLALQSHHCRELDVQLIRRLGSNVKIVIADDQTNNLIAVRRRLADPRVQTRAMSSPGDVRELSAEGAGLFDFVYAVSSLDWLTALPAQRLVRDAFQLVRPGGSLLLANLAPERGDGAYWEAFLDWWVVERSERALLEIARVAGQGNAETSVYRDGTGSSIFLRLTRIG